MVPQMEDAVANEDSEMAIGGQVGIELNSEN